MTAIAASSPRHRAKRPHSQDRAAARARDVS